MYAETASRSLPIIPAAFFAIILTTVVIPRIRTIPVGEHSMARHGAERVTPLDIAEQMRRTDNYEHWRCVALDKELYLVLMGLDDEWREVWGGRFVGLTLDNEITAFARPRKDWNYIIKRDHYWPENAAAVTASYRYGLRWWEE